MKNVPKELEEVYFNDPIVYTAFHAYDQDVPLSAVFIGIIKAMHDRHQDTVKFIEECAGKIKELL